MDYDRAYEEVEDLFGAKPDPLLEKLGDEIDARRPVLDLGSGQGRNSLYLAQRGYSVHGLDPSKVATEQLRRAAEREGLPITPYLGGFESFDPPVDAYAAVLAFGLIPDLGWHAIHGLARKVRSWTARGGLLFITGFTTADPQFEKIAAECEPAGRNSFLRPGGGLRTYLEPDEVLTLFRGFAVVYHWEGLGPEHRHGDSPPERHGKFELVAER